MQLRLKFESYILNPITNFLFCAIHCVPSKELQSSSLLAFLARSIQKLFIFNYQFVCAVILTSSVMLNAYVNS